MPPKRDPRRDRAAVIYIEHNQEITMSQLSALLAGEYPQEPPLTEGTLRGWKAKDRWSVPEPVRPERSEKRLERSNPGPERSVPQDEVMLTLSRADIQIINDLEANEDLKFQHKLFCLYYSRNFNATIAYQKVYGCSHESAMARGSALLGHAKVAEEIKKIKRIRAESVLLDEYDLLELHLRIVFADINDFVEYQNIQRPHLHNGKPIPIEDPDRPGKFLRDPNTDRLAYLSYNTNEIRFKSSAFTDGQLIKEIKQGRDGASIKLKSPDQSYKFLERFLGLDKDDGKGGGLAQAWIKAKLGERHETYRT